MPDPAHEHDWTRLRHAVTGKESNVEVCRVPGCREARGSTPAAQAVLDQMRCYELMGDETP